MEQNFINDIKQIITDFQQSLQGHLPALEAEINHLIQSNSRDKNVIEHSLDTLLSLTEMGIDDKLFVQLLDYYKTIDAEGALYYWNEYDEEEKKYDDE